MKTRLALLALACGITFAGNAQTTTDETLKPVAGDKTFVAGLGGAYRRYNSRTI
ncbi:hypothetical protein ACXYMU_00270 [Pontibacter sp. CAU 1760]